MFNSENAKIGDKVFIETDRWGSWKLGTICRILDSGKVEVSYSNGKIGDVSKSLYKPHGSAYGSFGKWDYIPYLTEFTQEEYEKRIMEKRARELRNKFKNFDYNILSYDKLLEIEKIIATKKEGE